MTNSTIHQTQLCSGDAGIEIVTGGTANLTATFTGNTVSDHEGDGLSAIAGGSSMLRLTVSGGNTFDSNWNGLTLEVDDGASATFSIAGNTFSNTSGNGIEILGRTGALAGSSFSGSIQFENNFTNISSGDAVKIDNAGLGTGTVLVHDNDFGSVPNGQGIEAIVGSGSATTGTLNLTITSNRLLMNNSKTGVLISATQSSTMCLDFGASSGPLQNTINAGDANDIELKQLDTSLLSVVGLGASTSTPSDVQTVLSSRNNLAGGASVSIATSILAGGASCPVP